MNTAPSKFMPQCNMSSLLSLATSGIDFDAIYKTGLVALGGLFTFSSALSHSYRHRVNGTIFFLGAVGCISSYLYMRIYGIDTKVALRLEGVADRLSENVDILQNKNIDYQKLNADNEKQIEALSNQVAKLGSLQGAFETLKKKAKVAADQSNDAATKSNDAATKSNDAATKSNDAATKSNDAATKSNDAATKSNDAATKVVEIADELTNILKEFIIKKDIKQKILSKLIEISDYENLQPNEIRQTITSIKDLVIEISEPDPQDPLIDSITNPDDPKANSVIGNGFHRVPATGGTAA